VKATKYSYTDGARPAFSVYKNSMPTQTPGTVTYNTVVLNNGGYMNTSTGLFTAPKAGIYHFTFSGFKQNGGYNPTSVVFIKNGTQQGSRSYLEGYDNYSPVSLATTMLLNANDTVGVYLQSGGLHGNGGQEFSGFFVGD
jgi:hypothetical protein